MPKLAPILTNPAAVKLRNPNLATKGPRASSSVAEIEPGQTVKRGLVNGANGRRTQSGGQGGQVHGGQVHGGPLGV